jgi:hypothetical protein
VSAGLMCIKAELLCAAGIISASELNVVIGRAAAIVDRPHMSAQELYSTLGSSGQIRSQRSCS